MVSDRRLQSLEHFNNFLTFFFCRWNLMCQKVVNNSCERSKHWWGALLGHGYWPIQFWLQRHPALALAFRIRKFVRHWFLPDPDIIGYYSITYWSCMISSLFKNFGHMLHGERNSQLYLMGLAKRIEKARHWCWYIDVCSLYVSIHNVYLSLWLSSSFSSWSITLTYVELDARDTVLVQSHIQRLGYITVFS